MNMMEIVEPLSLDRPFLPTRQVAQIARHNVKLLPLVEELIQNNCGIYLLK